MAMDSCVRDERDNSSGRVKFSVRFVENGDASATLV